MFQNKRVYRMFSLVLAAALFSVSVTAKAAGVKAEKKVEPIIGKLNMKEGQKEEIKIEIAPIYTELKMKMEEERRKQEVIEQEELLASIIFCEAGNQSYTGQVAVGAVVMNRMKHADYPDDLEEVIYQEGQFAPVTTGWLDKVRESSGYTDSAMEAARDALNGANPVGDCLFFDRGGSGMQIGDHFFH